jgi:Phycobilisome protein
MALSELAKALIIKARIVSFASWDSTHGEVAIALFQAADDQRLYLTDPELDLLAQLAPASATNLSIVRGLRDRAKEIVDVGRVDVLTAFPDILEPGGGLYPPERSAACWQDFWQFLRCITYGIAGGHVDYTSEAGLGAMEALYQELQVPLPAMIVGLRGIKAASLEGLEPAQQANLAPYFDHLIEKLGGFRETELSHPT